MKLFNYLEAISTDIVIKLRSIERSFRPEKDLFDFIDIIYFYKYIYILLEDVFKKNKIDHEDNFNLKIKYNQDHKGSLFDQKLEIHDLFMIDLKNKLDVFLEIKKIDKLNLNSLKLDIIELINKYKLIKSSDDFINLSERIFYRFSLDKIKIATDETLSLMIRGFIHDKVFHSLSEIESLKKFEKNEIYGGFDDPFGFNHEQIFKELQALQTDLIADYDEHEEARFDYDSIKQTFSNILKRLSNITEKNWHIDEPIINWKKFRLFFNGYDRLLSLFPKNKYPDDAIVVVDNSDFLDKIYRGANKYKDFFYKKSKQKNLPGFSNLEYKTLSNFQKKHDEKIQNFETEQENILKKINDFLQKLDKNNNNYIKKLKFRH